ncbi:MAG: aminotransferase class V-fold PLP-dependent enzyme [Verrucomicrobiota bacterium]|nr:aminotransferase class V-fold PLP-dependent enzyme [Verrucomicrobiota bacterium]
MVDITYLDNNATTAVDPRVFAAMRPFLEEFYANPSSGYASAAHVRAAIETAREQVAALLGCAPAEIIFTSGGTEANNLAFHSARQSAPERRHFVTTAVEHSAVLRPAQDLLRRGCEVSFLGVDHAGRLSLRALADTLTAETALLSVMWANNETGVVFPIEEIAAIAHDKGVPFHTDAIQAAGKIAIKLRDLPLQFLSISGHKIYAPKGVGALYVNRHARFHPLLLGGSHENDRRAGTENVASIVGLGKAAEITLAESGSEHARLLALRDRFEKALAEKIEDVHVNGSGASRLPNTSSLRFAGIDSSAALLMLDQQKICCSAGSACRTGSLKPSHVMTALGLNVDEARGALRFSFGRFNTDADVDRALEIIPRVIAKLRALSPALVR